MERQYLNGAVVTLTWHEVRPTDDEPVSFRDSVEGHLTDFEWSELLTPGTDLYNRWCAQVDVIAGFWCSCATPMSRCCCARITK